MEAKNNEARRWLMLGFSVDYWAKQGVSQSAPDAKAIEAMKAEYKTATLHERINRRGWTGWERLILKQY